MNIQNHPSYQSFGHRFPTVSVIESATGHILKNGNSTDRVKLIKDVLKMKERDLKDLNRDPMTGFLCLISSGKILMDKNPKFAPTRERLKDIIETDKTGELTSSAVKNIIARYGKEIDLHV